MCFQCWGCVFPKATLMLGFCFRLLRGVGTIKELTMKIREDFYFVERGQGLPELAGGQAGSGGTVARGAGAVADGRAVGADWVCEAWGGQCGLAAV